MIEKDAPKIAKVDGQPSSTTITPCSEEASSQLVGDDHEAVNDTDAKPGGQYPLTRSTPQHPHEKPQKSANRGADSRVWVTDLGHSEPTKATPTLSNRSKNRPKQWVTRSGHKRSTRGLSLRGSVQAGEQLLACLRWDRSRSGNETFEIASKRMIGR